MRSLVLVMLTLLLLSCAKRGTEVVEVEIPKIVECVVPKPPTIPPLVSSKTCSDGTTDYVCISPLDAANLGAFLQAFWDWRDTVLNCPGMKHPPEPLRKFIGKTLEETLPVLREKLPLE